MFIMKIFTRVNRKLIKWRLTPIRVFGLHHVSDTYNVATMWEEDWTQTEALKQFVVGLQNQGYIFISFSEANEKLKRDWLRNKRYAVLTADDGFKTLLNILPWLQEQRIPITLFVNPKYILNDGIGDNVQILLKQTHGTVANQELYLNIEDIRALKSSYISFACHGYEHLDERELDVDEFKKNVEQCMKALSTDFPNVIPFYAHTYGQTKEGYDDILRSYGLTPVYISGNPNYNNEGYIDRELLSNGRIINGKV